MGYTKKKKKKEKNAERKLEQEKPCEREKREWKRTVIFSFKTRKTPVIFVDNRLRTRLENLGPALNIGQSLCTFFLTGQGERGMELSNRLLLSRCI